MCTENKDDKSWGVNALAVFEELELYATGFSGEVSTADVSDQ